MENNMVKTEVKNEKSLTRRQKIGYFGAGFGTGLAIAGLVSGIKAVVNKVTGVFDDDDEDDLSDLGFVDDTEEDKKDSDKK